MSEQKVRSRKYAPRVLSGTRTEFYNDNGSKRSENAVTGTDVTGAQITVSTGHRWPPRESGWHGDIGGDFSSTKYYMKSPTNHVRAKGRDNIGLTGERKRTEWYTGPVAAYHASLYGIGNYPSPKSNAPVNSAVDAWGAEAVAACKPTNSAADAGTMIGELFKDGLPSLIGARTWENRTAAAKAAGDEYLNVQFGWKPLVSDIDSFINGMRHIGSILDQFNRDSGRLVRRRHTFPTTSSSSESNISTGVTTPSLSTDYRLNSWTTAVKTTEVVQRKWFSGAFTYYAPESFRGSGIVDTILSSADRFGLSLTPELLWELAPWSWAADWFTNAGDVISNVSDSQRYGLVMPYGYMMVNTITTVTVAPKNWQLKPAGATVPPCTFITESKVRRKAHPFGFGVTDTSLDSGQLAILAALGLSRSR